MDDRFLILAFLDRQFGHGWLLMIMALAPECEPSFGRLAAPVELLQ